MIGCTGSCLPGLSKYGDSLIRGLSMQKDKSGGGMIDTSARWSDQYVYYYRTYEKAVSGGGETRAIRVHAHGPCRRRGRIIHSGRRRGPRARGRPWPPRRAQSRAESLGGPGTPRG